MNSKLKININPGMASIVSIILAWLLLIVLTFFWNNYSLSLQALELVDITLHAIGLIAIGVSLVTFCLHLITSLKQRKITALLIINILVIIVPYILILGILPD